MAPAPHPLAVQTPKAAICYWVQSGVNKHSQRIDVTFLKALWAGIFLSYGGYLEAVVAGSPSAAANNPGLLKLVEGLVFPIGLTMIIFTGVDLLTSSMIIMPLAALRGRIPMWGVLNNFIIVLIGNMIGSLLVATLLGDYTLLFSASSTSTAPAREWLAAAATTKVVNLYWSQIYLRAIGCNIMVGAAIFLAGQVPDAIGKIVLIFLPIACFTAVGLEHVVADMFLIPSGILYGSQATVGLYIGKNLTACFLGNLTGGLALGLSLYYMYMIMDEAPETPYNDEKVWHLGPFGHNTFRSPFGGNSLGFGMRHTSTIRPEPVSPGESIESVREGNSVNSDGKVMC